MNQNIAKCLLDVEAVFLSPKEPFTWASGIKSPIYCDNRLILSDVKARGIIEQELANKIKEHYPKCTCVVGTATAGIAHAAIVAHKLSLPNAYVRTANKEHGRQNQIEGRILQTDKVVIIEDLISTGKSVISVIKTLQELNIEVLGVLSIFTYQLEKGYTNFKNIGIEYISLTNIETLTDVALHDNKISEEEKQMILAFTNNL